LFLHWNFLTTLQLSSPDLSWPCLNLPSSAEPLYNESLLRPCYIWFPCRCLYSNEFQDATNLMWNFSHLHQWDRQWRQCGRWYVARNMVHPWPSMSILLCPWPCPPASAMFIYSLFLRSLYCNNMHGQAIMDEFYKIRCVSFMLLNWSPIGKFS
jgi:hypothetical protein